MSKRTLGILGALARSVLDVGLDFFPQPEPGQTGTARADHILPALAEATDCWDDLDERSIDTALDLARASLAEVKMQTEYQDAKAARLLTVTSFVSALAGFLFTVFNTNYPLEALAPRRLPLHLLPAAADAAFLLFVVCALGGALVTFHATRTRFKYPVSPPASRSGTAVSFLFHNGIVGVPPAAWADSFVDRTARPAQLRHLKLEYLRNYVTESYLVAAKTADKLRYLQPAQSLLAWALRFLLLFTFLFASTACLVGPTKPPARPMDMVLRQPGGDFKVRAMITSSNATGLASDRRAH